MLIDSHCHLHYPGLAEQEADVVARAHAAGVGEMISISTLESEWEEVVAGACRHPKVFASIGVHPHEADGHGHVDAARLVAAAAPPRVVGLGETGLDYHYNQSSHEAQRRLFRAHIEAARETQLPVIVHTRDAEEETVAILADEQKKGAFPIVIHCFSGSQWLADSCLALGAWISISGIVTFRNAQPLRDTAKGIPLQRLLVETDSPFLAPVPMRGRANEPAFVVHTAKFLAELRGEPFDAFASQTAANTRAAFSRMVQP